ncbi:hypothetical protein PLESTB_000482800 [Pleodorina starrii]|uniref:SAM domain-containing protein n=1 Tax=Pleodorina starrii TaxID=330485 RepID=A0A9W6F0E2_9CHLO|nr:hypothetical protein PLESTM_001583600 [Pleodorina starrii]GLC51255.1 hypothetical protein PLESTB_000482800 [Pleodorina starrii]GLC63614.1 hypothetical protein PLESTF_000055200 [Pleodorina starrii]
MDEDSDDFGLDNSEDLEIDHGGSEPTKRANAPAVGSSLFSGEDDDFADGLPPQRASAPPPRQPSQAPSNRRGSSGLFSDNSDNFGADSGDLPPQRASAPPPRQPSQAPSNRRGSSGLFSDNSDNFGADSGDLPPQRASAPPPRQPSQAPSNRRGSSGLFSDNSDNFGANSGDLAPRRAPAPPPRSVPPPPSHRRDSGGLFSEDDGGDGDSYGLGLSAGEDLGTEIEIDHGDHGPAAGRQRPLPPPPGNYTNPSLSLDANDSDIADLLGPQRNGGAPSAPPPQLGPALKVTAPPPPARLPDPISSGGYGLEEEDSELREMLRESPQQEAAAAAPPPRPALNAGTPSNRRISFQEPVAAPLRPPPPPPPQQHNHARPHSGSFGDSSGSGYGLEHDASRDLAAPRPLAARRDAPSDDFGSGGDYGEVTFQGHVPGATVRMPPGGGASFKRIPSSGVGGYDPIQDPLDSPVGRDGRPPPRGIPPRRQVGESSEAYSNYDDDDFEEEYGNNDVGYGGRGDGSGGNRHGGGDVAFRRVPAPEQRGSPPPRRPAAPSPPGDDDDYEDTFADDTSWDGEIPFAPGGGDAGRGRAVTSRPGSARQPRSRGPHASGDARLRATSALPPRERQAAMIEDMLGRHPGTWDIREVATWIEFIGLGQYRPKFVHHSVDGRLLLSLGEAELARDLRILPLGHRRALLAAIAQLREAAAAMGQQQQHGSSAGAGAKGEAARVAELRRRAAEQGAGRRPSSAGARVIPPEPFLGPAAGKMTVYEQRAKLLYHLDRAKHRAAQHAAIIEQLSSNKALTEAQVAELRGKLKDLEAKHRDDFSLSPTRRRGMTAPVTSSPGGRRGGAGAVALAAAEYGADATVPWLPVGRGTRTFSEHPERFARTGEDAEVDLTFRPRVVRIQEVPAGAVRDIVSKALKSRTPFWKRMESEFVKVRREREAREEARRKRRERMGVVKRGGEDDDEQQAKSKHWNNYWVPNNCRDLSYHKNYRRNSENEELKQYRSFTKDKTRLSRWFKRFVEDDEHTEGDVALERLVNRMIRALVKTRKEMEAEVGETFDKRIRRYFAERGYKFDTHTSNTIMVRARGAAPPRPEPPDTKTYDFEEVEQYYPDYLKKKDQDKEGADNGGGEDGPYMVQKRTRWKRLVEIYYMERQKKIRAAISMVKMAQFVQRHGPRWPKERDRDDGKKAVWVPSSAAGALHQPDGRDRTFNEVGRENITLHAKLKKALAAPEPMDTAKKMKQEEEAEAKAEAFFWPMGWPHSSGDPDLGPPSEPLLLAGDGEGGGGEGEGFGLAMDGLGHGGGGGGRRHRWTPPLDFYGALDALLDRGRELRRLQDEWVDEWHRARERGYGEEDLHPDPPRAEDLSWSDDDPLVQMQARAMERQRHDWLLAWERARLRRERQSAKMRSQGYREEDIEQRLGPQQEASDVEYAVQNQLLANVELLARLKEADLARFKTGLRGTKKMMAVYRALRNQMFLDETRAREQRREENLRAVYESLRPGSRRVISPGEEAEILARLEEDAAKRAERQRELLESKLAEEESSLTPWYLRPRTTTSRPPSQPTSRATSPRGRRSTRSPPSQPSAGGRSPRSTSTPRRPSSAGRGATRGTSGGGAGGPLEGEGSSRSKYVFGSSTPKSMWGPMGPVRQTPRRIGTSLLDFPGLQGGHSTLSLDPQGQQRQPTPGRATRSGGGGGAATPTPTRQRPSTPTRTPGGGGGGGATPGGGGGASRTPAPPQRPRSAPAPPASASRPTREGGDGGGGGGGGGAGPPGPAGRRPTSAAPPSSARGGGGGSAPGTRPTSAAPPSPRSRAPPASPGRGRSPAAAPPASPRRGMPRVGFAASPSPTRSSGGGSLAARAGAGAGGHAAPAARRGLMDGDTTSGTPSPERGPPRRYAGGAGIGPGSAATAAAAALQRRRGLADSDSSPSPQPRGRPQPQPGSPLAAPSLPAAGGAGVGAGGGPPASAGASASSGLGLPIGGGGGGRAVAAAPARASGTGSASGDPPGRASGTGSAGPRASATGSAGGGGPAAGSRRPSTPPPPPGSELVKQESVSSIKSSRTTASGNAGSRTGGSGAAVTGRGTGQGASATGSAGGGGPAAGSRRPSTPPPPPGAELVKQESVSSIKSSRTTASGNAGSRTGGSGAAVAGRGTGQGVSATGSAGEGGPAAGSRRPSTPPPPPGSELVRQESVSSIKSTSEGGPTPQKSPISRSPQGSPQASPSYSPPAASPPLASPRDASPPAASPRAPSPHAPSPQASQPRMAAVEAEATEVSAGLGEEDEYEMDEYEIDAEDGEELDYGDEGAAEF